MAVRDYLERGQALVPTNPLPVVFAALALLVLLDLVRQLVVGSLPLSTFLTFGWEGVVFGMGIGLAGIGLAMTYSILTFANFAHGDLITAGAFAGWATAFVAAGAGQFSLETLVLIGGPEAVSSDLALSITTAPLVVVVGFVVAVALTAGLALLVDRIVFRPMRTQSGVSLLIASVGVALVLRHLIQFFFQPSDSLSVTHSPAIPSAAVPVGAGSVSVGAHEVTLVVVAGLLMAGVHVLLRYTKLGTAMRALADNEDLARVTGISTERVVLFTWLIGGALTGAAGFLIGLQRGFIDLTLGWDLLLLIFAGVILGGIGSVYGAIAGGLAIGLMSQLSLIWLPSEFTNVAAFVVMIAVLLVRPSGIFGGVTSV